MNFLWERVDPRQIQADAEREKDERIGRRSRDENMGDTNLEEEAPPPPPSAFITDEQLTNTLMWQVEGYIPHNQSVRSLRDLLSLALLRLTTDTKQPESEVLEADERDEDADREKQQQQERKEVLERLCNYVHGYCQRYSKRLVDIDFASLVGPQLIFENHFTLGRILLEFYDKVQLFTRQDLRRCLLLVFGALFWPEATRMKGKGSWEVFLTIGFEPSELQKIWQETNMGILTSVLITEAWGKSLSWNKTQYDVRLVQRFMLARELVNKIEGQTGAQFWENNMVNTYDSHDFFGFRLLRDLVGKKKSLSINELKSEMKALANYLTPAEEKYQSLFEWWELKQGGVATSKNAVEFQQLVNSLDMKKEAVYIKQLGRNGIIKSLSGDEKHCPACYIDLPLQHLQGIHHFELQLCPNCGKAVLYWKPMLTFDAV